MHGRLDEVQWAAVGKGSLNPEETGHQGSLHVQKTSQGRSCGVLQGTQWVEAGASCA